ncbi:nucleoside hydrolase [uncultured Paludibaculum sp.]|uniref:nucleoside hydrolase n=1 Tax=uncultured Paludibaculum sp. TaxID=1765020 RepID=UPI002AAC428C|nr:nucleoside hydrolase [uncultured Paludibaculum sp.]
MRDGAFLIGSTPVIVWSHTAAHKPPPAQRPSTLHAADFLIQATRAAGGPRRALCAGAQTKLAMAPLKDPTLADRLEEVVVMEFSFQTGVDPYNVGGDLVAARVVLGSGIPLTILPVEIGVACQMAEAEYAECLAAQRPQG